MSYRILNVFCAAPGGMEAEQAAFYRAVARVNEGCAIASGVLFAPLAVPQETTDKTRFQASVDYNIRNSTYFLLAIEGTWGAPPRSFECDYQLALQCQADPALPTREIAVLLKQPAAGGSMEPSVSALRHQLASGGSTRVIHFRTADEFETQVRLLLGELVAGPVAEVTRRDAADVDRGFVRQLIMDTVADELGMASWPENLRGPLLKIQYEARIKSLRENYPGATEEIMQVNDEPGGWVVVDRGTDAIRLVDIAILPRFRGNGLGTRRIQELIAEADRDGKPVRLSVVANNRALRLYQRLGFIPTGGDGVRIYMERPVN